MPVVLYSVMDGGMGGGKLGSCCEKWAAAVYWLWRQRRRYLAVRIVGCMGSKARDFGMDFDGMFTAGNG